MTKLKNTKKGMAKKALSISLVVAMLATSNVPVWAAEDLFSDGSAAVEAPQVFTSDAAATPVEEVTPDAPELAAVDEETAKVEIAGINDNKIDIHVNQTIAIGNTNIYFGANENINVNWYAVDDTSPNYVVGQTYSEETNSLAYGFLSGAPAEKIQKDGKDYITANYASTELKKYLGNKLKAVVWQQDASDASKWKVVAISDPALIVSSNPDDYVDGFTSLGLNKSGAIAYNKNNTVTIKDPANALNDSSVTIQWYRKDAEGQVSLINDATKKSYTATSSDIGYDIYPVVTLTVDGVDSFYYNESGEQSVLVYGVKSFEWSSNGTVIEEDGIAYDAGSLSLKVELPEKFTDAKLTLTGQSGQASVGENNNGVINASYDLSKEDIDTTIKATVTIGNYTFTDEIKVTDAYITLTGKPVIKVKEGGADIRPGVKLQADTTNVKATTGANFTNFSYQWQKWDDAKGEYVNILPNGNGETYEVQTDDYGAKIRVAVYGGEFYNQSKSVFSDDVTVEADDVTENSVKKDWDNGFKGTKTFNPLNSEANKLVDGDGKSQVKILYTNKDKKQVTLKTSDYTLKYEGIDQIGTVKVTVYLLPTINTDYSSGEALTFTYTLTAPTETDAFEITSSNTKSEYDGDAVTPTVKVVNTETNQTIDSSEYKVFSVGPDAGKYTVNAYVNAVGKMATSEMTHTINPKKVADHTSDFNVVIPDAVWDASKAAVESNTVKDAKIQVFDTTISNTEDLLEEYKGKTYEDANGIEHNVVKIEAINWDEGGVKKSIKITFDDGILTGDFGNQTYECNYDGSITVEGKVNSRSISQFKTAISDEALNYIYNGKQQDALGEILKDNNGYIPVKNSNGESVKLYEGRDFEYKIIKGGTNVGDVSIYVEGKGNYDGNMTLSNVYEIGKAYFNNTGYVEDNLDKTTSKINISYDPSLGDAGADISAYTELIKSKYTLKIASTNYALTLGKDYWLDKVSSDSWQGDLIDDVKNLWLQPTVRENKVAGHGENANFYTDATNGVRNAFKATLVNKNLNDSDIKVTVESAEYNGGKLVTPKVKVAYVKDGKEYVISSDYYDVQIIQSAYGQGETGKVNIVAKQDLVKKWDSQKYPQLYTGNKMVDYTVSTANLALGKIVATNGLSTLPSVAYDAAQAATETGITLAASKYVVKDASGNIVDPKFYTVSFTDNKNVGTATITVTGKAPYEGSISSTFTITKNNLPSGTVTLMSDKLSKVYTGEGIELVKGTDYNITGELAGLTEGTDYMIVYDNNINVTSDKEKAAFKVVGINNYAGEVVSYFDITPATITASNIKLGDAVYQGGVAVRPAVTITIPGGNATLTEGTDYTVSYLKAATDAGDEGLVQITYADNKNINTKDSAKEATYTVTAKDLKDVTILEIADQEATGEQLTPEVTVMNGTVKLVEGKDYKVTYGENKEIGVGTVTIQPADGNKNYTGSQGAAFNIIKATPEVGQAMISKVEISGNTVTPVLSAEVDGAVGYDFVLSRSDDPTDTAARVDVSKNVLKTNTNFYYVEAGTYYIYCHAYNRDEDKIKQFGEWSNSVKVVVTATTPETPVITKMQKSSNGKHLKITWTKSTDATGYDVVMGTAARKVNGELRPVDYGTAVKKITNGNTVSVIFYNIPKGTYYVGLHAYNRTSESGVKVFSKWSGAQKVTFK